MQLDSRRRCRSRSIAVPFVDTFGKLAAPRDRRARPRSGASALFALLAAAARACGIRAERVRARVLVPRGIGVRQGSKVCVDLAHYYGVGMLHLFLVVFCRMLLRAHRAGRPERRPVHGWSCVVRVGIEVQRRWLRTLDLQPSLPLLLFLHLSYSPTVPKSPLLRPSSIVRDVLCFVRLGVGGSVGTL